MNLLEQLTTESIQNQPIPISDLLEDSFYYPSSGFDGGIVKHYANEIQSFIYCDYATGEEAFLQEMKHFYGYKVLAHRSVSQAELVPQGWRMQVPPPMEAQRYLQYQEKWQLPFAHWALYERIESFDAGHGPKRFSLLYIGGEAVATYQALYWSHQKSAKALAIIQPGTGFGFNWTNFKDRKGALAWVVMNNAYGQPDLIFYGGNASGYDHFNWEEYQYQSRIKPYYSGEAHGEVTLWLKR